MIVISLSKQAMLLIDITKANRHAVQVPLALEVYENEIISLIRFDAFKVIK